MAKSKVPDNSEVIDLLINIADAYEIKGKSIFRINSYRYAADSVKALREPAYDLWQQGKLNTVPYIGKNIYRKLDFWFRTGRFHPHVIRAFKNIHPAVFTLTKINGIGPKIAHKLTQNLKFPQDPLKALDRLVAYAQKGKIRTLPTFGLKSEEKILSDTQAFLGRKSKMTYSAAKAIADQVISYLSQQFPTTEFYPLGSLRRQSAGVGDIDIAAKSTNSNEILDCFVSYPGSLQTIALGLKKVSIRLAHDIRVDLMVQKPATFGSLLQHFTGSREHNIKLRTYALKLGFSLSEYGIKDLHSGQIHTFSTEEDFYHFLKLSYIDPQDRLGEDEIQVAAQKYYNITNTN